MDYVTWQDLLQFSMVLITLISTLYMIFHDDKRK